MARKSAILKRMPMETLVERCANEGVAAIAKELGCSDKSIYYLLRGRTPSNKGGKVARTIPAHEIVAKPVDAEMREIAEKNEQNACVVLEKCTVSLKGSVGSYTLFTTDDTVNIAIKREDGDRSVYIDMCRVSVNELLDLADELKAVAQCAKQFNVGNAMW